MPAREMETSDIDKLLEEARAAQEPATTPQVEDLDEDDEKGLDTEQGPPPWAKVPAGFKFPQGWLIWFIRFPAAFTNRPGGGERQCILWNLSEADEKRAAKLARGDGMRVIDEMTKAMIRSVDGKKISWAPVDPKEDDGQYASVTTFWNEIGGKCRAQLKNLYLKQHNMDAAENARFFEQCAAPRTVG